MKLLFPFVLCCLIVTKLSFAYGWQDDYDSLLAKYASSEGVSYEAWYHSDADRNQLVEIVGAIGKVQTRSLQAVERKAFYINAYNAWMIHLVLENYPIKSVTEIGSKEFSVFSDKLIVINKKKTSLDDLEKKTLLKEFPDARLHFAVNCASTSCPPLLDTSYKASILDEQLDQNAITFLNSSQGVIYQRANEAVCVSSLFDWYRKDFLSNHPKGIISYLNQFRDFPLPNNLSVKFIPYDWSLNSLE